MRKLIVCFFIFIISFKTFAQSDVKIEIFHVDLVLLAAAYGAGEAIFEEAMKNTMDKIISAQATTDSMFRNMVILEQKTQEYQRNLQAHLLNSVNESFFDDMLKIIDDNQKWMNDFAAFHPDYKEIIDEHEENVKGRAHNIKKYINNVTKKTGNEGRLDNVQRNDMNLYVIEEMRELSFVSQSLKRMLNTLYPDDNTFKMPIKIERP